MIINAINKHIFSFKSLPQSENDFSYLIKKKDILIIILYLNGGIIYLISLSNITGKGIACLFLDGIQCFYAIVILIFISSILTSFSIYLILFKNYLKIHLIIIFIIYSFFYFIDHNALLIKHGFFNFILFILISLILFLLLIFIHFLIYLIKKRKYFYFILFNFPIIFLFFFIKIYKLKNFSCNTWAKGLNQTEIDNNSKDYPCIITFPKPHSCFFSELGVYFDFTSKIRPTCLNNNLLKYEKVKILKDLGNLKMLEKSKKKNFGYPLTNNDEFNPSYFGSLCYPGKKNFENYVNEKVILMDLYNKNKKKYYPNISKPEIELILEDYGGKIIFNIQRNKTLIKEREKIIKKKKLLYKNILILFLDTLSRAHFHRKFPKTIKFLNKFSKYETNESKKNMTIFQYFKYNSLFTYTDPNLKAAYYGAKNDGSGIHFSNFFKNNGYIIGRVNAFCEKESVFDEKNDTKFLHGTWDHEGLSLGCIKGFYDRFLVSRLSSLIKKCLFGKDLNEHSLDYLKSFWEAYIEQYKLFLYQTLDGHEPTGQLIGYFDEILYNFINEFYSKGWLNDTIIILFSDHGQHLSGPLYLFDSQDFFFERSLPTLFMILPNDKRLYKNNLYEKIKANQQTFITPFDIYNTLVHLAFGEVNKMYKKFSVPYGGSLLTELNYKERYCQSPIYQSQIYLQSCFCKFKIYQYQK